MYGGGWGITPVILEALRKATITGVAKFAVELSTTTPYRWTTGLRKVTIDSDVYYPKGMKIPSIDIASGEMSSSLTVEDVPTTASPSCLAEHNYTERFSGLVMTWHLGTVSAGVWSSIYIMTWVVKACRWRLGQFQFNLAGTSGLNPRSGLPLFSRRCNLLFKGQLCSTGAGAPSYGGFSTCSGTEAECIARHGATGPSNIIPFRGLLYAPEQGDSIKLNESASAVFGGGSIGGGSAGGSAWRVNRWEHDGHVSDDRMIHVFDFVQSAAQAVVNPADTPISGAGDSAMQQGGDLNL